MYVWRMGEVCQWGSFVWFSGGLFSRVLYSRWNWPSDTVCYCIQWIGIYFELVQDQYHSSVVYLEQEYYGYSRLFVGMLGSVMCHCWWRAETVCQESCSGRADGGICYTWVCVPWNYLWSLHLFSFVSSSCNLSLHVIYIYSGSQLMELVFVHGSFVVYEYFLSSNIKIYDSRCSSWEHTTKYFDVCVAVWQFGLAFCCITYHRPGY